MVDGLTCLNSSQINQARRISKHCVLSLQYKYCTVNQTARKCEVLLLDYNMATESGDDSRAQLTFFPTKLSITPFPFGCSSVDPGEALTTVSWEFVKSTVALLLITAVDEISREFVVLLVVDQCVPSKKSGVISNCVSCCGPCGCDIYPYILSQSPTASIVFRNPCSTADCLCLRAVGGCGSDGEPKHQCSQHVSSRKRHNFTDSYCSSFRYDGWSRVYSGACGGARRAECNARQSRYGYAFRMYRHHPLFVILV